MSLKETIKMLIQDSQKRISIEVPNMNLETEDRVKLMDFIHILEMSSIPTIFKYFKLPGVLKINKNNFAVDLMEAVNDNYNLLHSVVKVYKEIWILFLKYTNDEIDMDTLTSNIFPIVNSIYNNIDISVEIRTGNDDPTVDLEFYANKELVARIVDVTNPFLKSFEQFTDKVNLFQLIKIIDEKLNTGDSLLKVQRRCISFSDIQQEFVELLSFINETKELSHE
ncbi:g057 [Yersinia phage phiR1-37]|uniref:hypothetical protein n=1 Tax=Yersinia phage phiR1-37 TaxID=331278 RepID=UPI00022DBCE5|nr:hypothetical protein phiR1-37_gp057 [Yersinia phage phiR1-37]CCE26081.1 g057 [Yersinia phage phiR1-37]